MGLEKGTRNDDDAAGRPCLVIALVAALACAGCALGSGGARMPPRAPAAAGPPQTYEAGRAFLVGNAPEAAGYGLYSYVLFGTPPTAANRDAYLQAVAAYLEYIPPIGEMEQNVPRRQLNITYLPITESPPPDVAAFRPTVSGTGSARAATWVLDHYDYGRARLLLSRLGPRHGEGPYLVSSLRPLSAGAAAEGERLRQDLSGAPADFMHVWMGEFLKQAASPAEWSHTSLSSFVLKLRSLAVATADRWPQIVASVKQRIQVE